jgi:hypothetical protein
MFDSALGGFWEGNAYLTSTSCWRFNMAKGCSNPVKAGRCRFGMHECMKCPKAGHEAAKCRSA